MKFQFGPRYPSRTTQVSRTLKSILKAKFYKDAFPLRTGLTNAIEALSRFLFETESHGVRLLLPPLLYFYWTSRVPLYIAIQAHCSLWWEFLLYKTVNAATDTFFYREFQKFPDWKWFLDRDFLILPEKSSFVNIQLTGLHLSPRFPWVLKKMAAM